MTLIPEFDSSVHEYAATTSNATNKVTATSDDPDAEITIMLGDTEIENGESATWVQGEGNLIEVTVGDNPDKYVVMVTSYPKQQSDEEVNVDIAGHHIAFGNSSFNGTAIDAVIAAQTLDTTATVTLDSPDGVIAIGILPVVSDMEDNEYVDAGITLEGALVTPSFTKKYAITAQLTTTGIDLIPSDKIIDVDEDYEKIPFLAVYTFEDLTDEDEQSFTTGWNVLYATIDKATHTNITGTEVVSGVDVNDYVVLSNSASNEMAISGVSGSDLFNGVIYILP